MSNVIIFQVRRGRTVAGGKVTKDVTDFVAANNITSYRVINGEDVADTIDALFAQETLAGNDTLFIERASPEGLDFYAKLAAKLGVSAQTFTVPSSPRTRKTAIDTTNANNNALAVA
jgi:hypothetical protein